MTEYSRTFKLNDPLEYHAIRIQRVKAAIPKLEMMIGAEVLKDIRENGPATVSVSLTMPTNKNPTVEMKAEVTR